MAALQELHERAYDPNSSLRGMLFDLKTLDIVRVIEDVDVTHVAERQIADEAE